MNKVMGFSVSRRQVLCHGGMAALAMAVGGCGRASREREAALPAEGLKLPFWTQRFERPEGGELAMGDLQGRPLLVNFWATWCPPCVQELPLIDRFYKENEANGWKVVGLAVDRPEAVRRFLRRLPLAFPVGLASAQDMKPFLRASDGDGALPFTIVFDAQGAIVGREKGMIDSSDLESWRRAQLRG